MKATGTCAGFATTRTGRVGHTLERNQRGIVRSSLRIRAQGKAQTADIAIAMARICNAAMRAKVRFHVSIFPGHGTSVVVHS